MVAITSIYIAFCVGCVIYALLWTPFRRYWARIQRAALLKKLGLRTGEYHPISIIINEIPQVALSSSVINTVLPDSSEGQDGSAEQRPSDEEQTNVWYTARTTPDERERASPSGHASARASPAAPTGTKDDPSPQLAFTGDDDNDPLVEMTDASPMMDERMTMGASNSNPTGVQSGASHMSSVSTSHNNNNSSKREKRRLLPN
ncbi:membrane-associated protein, putative [Bodo saltans]|uniref:Membrane-associated protein, putative n=1 Tax=Bodo saltans TaxID=75058 RepID=A0A0S4J4K5_BODSA|nr:membrane-associated protein, putative [Bodo saltans]|eukprot:CUG86402.1 membrane-associated protein, putative [Bodo saltans]